MSYSKTDNEIYLRVLENDFPAGTEVEWSALDGTFSKGWIVAFSALSNGKIAAEVSFYNGDKPETGTLGAVSSPQALAAFLGYVNSRESAEHGASS